MIIGYISIHHESKKGATVTMAITLSILDHLQNSFAAAKSSKFPIKPTLVCPPHINSKGPSPNLG